VTVHTDLPIYRAAYDLLDVATDTARQMRRDVKPFLGRKLIDECVELTVLIQRANRAKDKLPHLNGVQERVQAVEVLFRICRDKRFTDTGRYAKAVSLTQSVGRQATGWSRSRTATQSPAA
jgi:hypothetical protein